MKEIEIKIQITDDQRKTLVNWLEQNAKFAGEKRQVEHYLDNPSHPFKFKSKFGYIDTEKYLRVRFSDKGDSICLKTFSIDPDGRTANTGEFETDVKDGKEALDLFIGLGFTDDTIVDKARKSFTYQNFEIELDEVEGLGSFVEIEVKEHGDDIQAGLKQIYDLLRKIGITKFTKQSRGYASMLWNPDVEFGSIKEI